MLGVSWRRVAAHRFGGAPNTAQHGELFVDVLRWTQCGCCSWAAAGVATAVGNYTSAVACPALIGAQVPPCSSAVQCRWVPRAQKDMVRKRACWRSIMDLCKTSSKNRMLQVLSNGGQCGAQINVVTVGMGLKRGQLGENKTTQEGSKVGTRQNAMAAPDVHAVPSDSQPRSCLYLGSVAYDLCELYVLLLREQVPKFQCPFA